MTTALERSRTRAPSPGRSEVDLIATQLHAIELWNRLRAAAVHAEEAATLSRERRMDLRRRMDVLREEHRAIVECTQAQWLASLHVLTLRPLTRAVLVHRSEWFADKVCEGLTEQGVDVVARLDNGAHAIGCVVAEQPDLLLVQDALPMVSGVEVVREVRRFAPVTRIGAHVEHDVRIAEMLDAGASRAWSRRVPPSDVTGDLHALLQDVPSMSGPAGDSHATG